MRRVRSRISNVTAGLVAAVVILVACYLVFGGPIPFSGAGFQLRAVFTAETNLHLDSPVRIAGVEVGKVTSVNREGGSSSAAVVTMAIQSNGLPIHTNATINVRPRLFLEGNFYVDLFPGTPSAPIIKSGGLLPVANTAGPVQLDRVLSALTAPARANLQALVQGLGGAFDGVPTAAQDASQDPTQRGLTAGQSLNQSLRYASKAFEASAIVNQALLGQQPHDLSGAIKGTSNIFAALAASGAHLSHLVTSFDTTMAALAARQQDLSQTIALLPPTLRETDAALGPLQASFAPTRQFARQLLPGVRQTGSTIAVGLPWEAQAAALFSKQDLGGLLSELTPAVQGTSAALTATRGLLRGSNALALCFSRDIVPTGNQRISDLPITSGLQVYQELFQSAVGIAGASQNFDGNGRYVRAAAGGGALREQTGPIGSDGPLYGNAVLPTLGTRPAKPAAAPPLNRSVQCDRFGAPNLNSATTGTGP